MPLPQSIYDRIADPDWEFIDIPAGTYDIEQGEEITIARSNLYLRGLDVILHPVSPVQQVLTINSGNTTWMEGTATIAVDTVTLNVVDASTIVVGDVHLVRFGVAVYDAQEPKYSKYLTVASKTSTSITYTEAFGETVETYADYDALVAAGADPQKVGPMGFNQYGYFARGLGTSHQIVIFPNGEPTTDVTVEGLTVSWDSDYVQLYGNIAFTTAFSLRTHFRNLKVINPISVCILNQTSDYTHVNGLTVTGAGKAKPFGQSQPTTMTGAIIGFWGGNNCLFENIISSATSMRFMSLESGSRDCIFRNLDITTSDDPAYTAFGQHFGIGGSHEGMILEKVKLNVPPLSSSCFTSGTNVEIRGFNIATDAVPDWFRMEELTFPAGLTIGKLRFGPAQAFETTYTLTAVDSFLKPPKGILIDATLSIESRTGVVTITPISDVDYANTAPDTVFDLEQNNIGVIVVGDTFADYYEYMQTQGIRVLRDNADPFTVVLSGTYFPLMSP